MVIVGVGLVVGLVLFVCFGSSVSIFLRSARSGRPTRGRAQPAGCVQDGSGESWPLPGVYRDNASASLKIEPAEKYHVSGGGSVLVVVLNSGRA